MFRKRFEEGAGHTQACPNLVLGCACVSAQLQSYSVLMEVSCITKVARLWWRVHIQHHSSIDCTRSNGGNGDLGQQTLRKGGSADENGTGSGSTSSRQQQAAAAATDDGNADSADDDDHRPTDLPTDRPIYRCELFFPRGPGKPPGRKSPKNGKNY